MHRNIKRTCINTDSIQHFMSVFSILSILPNHRFFMNQYTYTCIILVSCLLAASMVSTDLGQVNGCIKKSYNRMNIFLKIWQFCGTTTCILISHENFWFYKHICHAKSLWRKLAYTWHTILKNLTLVKNSLLRM